MARPSKFFIRNGTEVTGPMTKDELLDTARGRGLNEFSAIRRGDDGDWLPAIRVEGIRELIASQNGGGRSRTDNPDLANAKASELNASASANEAESHLREPLIGDAANVEGPFMRYRMRVGLVGALLVAVAVAIWSLIPRDPNSPQMKPSGLIVAEAESHAAPTSQSTGEVVVTSPTEIATASETTPLVAPTEPAAPMLNDADKGGGAVTVGEKQLELPELIEKVEKSVVRIDVKGQEFESIGSGFVVGPNGWVVTNHHVIEKATSATVTFSNRVTIPVEGVVKSDKDRDLAILKLTAIPNCEPLNLAKAFPRKGERVAVFGAPKGLSFSASEGIISGVRSTAELEEFGIKGSGTWIQSTAAISPGNSGGPIVDRTGTVVGITSWYARNSQNLNLGISAHDAALLIADSSNAAVTAFSAGPSRNEANLAFSQSQIVIEVKPSIVVLPPKRKFFHPFSVKEKYDRFKDEHSIDAQVWELKNTLDRVPEYNFVMNLTVKLENGKQRFPQRDYILMSIAMDGSNGLEMMRLVGTAKNAIFLADDERLTVPLISKSELVDFRGGFIALALPASLVAKVAYAKSPAFKAGQYEYEFTVDQKEAIREFLSYVGEGKSIGGVTEYKRYANKDEPVSDYIRAKIDQAVADTETRIANERKAIERAQEAEEARLKADSPEEKAKVNEKRASGKVQLAREFLKSGQSEKGRTWLKEVIREYPGTKGAEEADLLLRGKTPPTSKPTVTPPASEPSK